MYYYHIFKAFAVIFRCCEKIIIQQYNVNNTIQYFFTHSSSTDSQQENIKDDWKTVVYTK